MLRIFSSQNCFPYHCHDHANSVGIWQDMTHKRHFLYVIKKSWGKETMALIATLISIIFIDQLGVCEKNFLHGSLYHDSVSVMESLVSPGHRAISRRSSWGLRSIKDKQEYLLTGKGCQPMLLILIMLTFQRIFSVKAQEIQQPVLPKITERTIPVDIKEGRDNSVATGN